MSMLVMCMIKKKL